MMRKIYNKHGILIKKIDMVKNINQDLMIYTNKLSFYNRFINLLNKFKIVNYKYIIDKDESEILSEVIQINTETLSEKEKDELFKKHNSYRGKKFKQNKDRIIKRKAFRKSQIRLENYEKNQCGEI